MPSDRREGNKMRYKVQSAWYKQSLRQEQAAQARVDNKATTIAYFLWYHAKNKELVKFINKWRVSYNSLAIDKEKGEVVLRYRANWNSRKNKWLESGVKRVSIPHYGYNPFYTD